MRQTWPPRFVFVLCLVLTVDLSWSVELTTNMTEILREHKIIPDCVPIEPPQFLEVNYVHTVVEFGIQLDTLTVMYQPTDLKWKAEKDSYYTILLTGLDVPTRENNSVSQYKHWIVGNVPGNAFFAGETIVEYVGTGLPYGKGMHRLVFLVYEQPDKKRIIFDEEIVRKESNKELRMYFCAQKFFRKYNMQTAIAINFMRVEELL
ncbi:protein D1 [Bemisia tabaci]|uniref:protein D1 n=1 Tax=Bemisia tabaci TaxID=7038 RepID=UPI003B28B94A